VCRLIHRHAGISLHPGKQAMIAGRLARRLRATGHESFAGYLDHLERGRSDAAKAERQAFVNCLTTNLTAFFREAHHFEVLARALQARPQPPWRIWCNAASTGEEPYSVAMTAVESVGAQAEVTVVASDIDTEVLETARRGVYAADARGLDRERLRLHFLRGTGSNAGRIRVRPELARRVQLRHFNLAGNDWSGLGERFDAIFCRNVMIYFDRATQRRVLQHMHAAMKPGALLFVGHSENFTDAAALFRLRGKTVYERV
jgi:chemotaxis protein methyltransferase CheR